MNRLFVVDTTALPEYGSDGELIRYVCEHYISRDAFDDKIKHKVYEKQAHKCSYCDISKDGHTYPSEKEENDIKEMEGDHIIPWSKGGKTEESNCQMLCKWHNGHKSAG